MISIKNFINYIIHIGLFIIFNALAINIYATSIDNAKTNKVQANNHQVNNTQTINDKTNKSVTNIIIGASAIPHAEILKQVKALLIKDNINLIIVEFNDYIIPNIALIKHKIDANYFQHQLYLNEFNHIHHTNLITLTNVHIEPMGIYLNDNSKFNKIKLTKNIIDLPKGLTIGIPNDITNETRAILLLEQFKLIGAIPRTTIDITKKNIKNNYYQFKILELDPAMLPRMLKSHNLDMAIINSNYALQANLIPQQDALFVENNNNPYINVIAIRDDEKNNPAILQLAKAMHSATIKDFILKNYHGAIIPVN